MHPLLGGKKITTVIVNRMKDGESSGPESQEGEDSYGMDACAEKLMKSIDAKDAKGVASALRDAFSMLEASSEYKEE